MKQDHKEEKKYPEPVAGALIVNNEGKVLLSRGRKWSGKYTVFGGHVEMGEMLDEAVKREVKEETGLDVEIEARLRFGEDIFSKHFARKAHFIFLDFLCRYTGDPEAVKTNEEFEDKFGWYSIEEALELDLAKGTREIIEAYRKYLKEKDALESWKRCMADFENYKKRQAENQKELREYAKEDVLLQLVPVVDNFHASTDHVPEDQRDQPWVTGIMYIQKQLEKLLEDNGVEEVGTKEGDVFSPEIHEAVSHEGKGEKIAKVVQRGYKMGSKVIRAAKVIVD